MACVTASWGARGVLCVAELVTSFAECFVISSRRIDGTLEGIPLVRGVVLRRILLGLVSFVSLPKIRFSGP
jgi:hypothetical protein